MGARATLLLGWGIGAVLFITAMLTHLAVLGLFFVWAIYSYVKLLSCVCPVCGTNLGSHLQNMDLISGKCVECSKK